MLFFDSYNLESQWRRGAKIRQMKTDVAHYQSEIERLKMELSILRSDPSEVERLARERYQMRRNGEDVYVVN
jgi:cell division protein FtsB